MSTEHIPTKQLAAVSDSAQSGIEIREIPVVQPDELKPGRALVKVLYSGVCHTDLHVMKDDWPLKAQRPCIAGHEGAGIIVAMNDPLSALKIGQKVGIKWIAGSCNQCQFCLEGEEPLCPDAAVSGLTTSGSFQQYCPAFTSQLSPLPDNLDMTQAAPILCAGTTVYKAIKNARVRPGQWLCVQGAGGGLGSLALQYAKYMGLSVVAVDTGNEKKALCERLGARSWVDFKTVKPGEMVKAIKAATPDGLGPHAAIVLSPKPEAYEEAMSYIRPRGTVVAVGLPPAGAIIKADVFDTVVNAKTLTGSYVGNRLDTLEALNIAAGGYVKTPIKVMGLMDLPQVLEDMENGKITGRVVLDLFK